MGGDFDLIIFDCDGTLVDTETVNNQVTLELINELAGTHYTRDYAFDAWAGKTLESVLLSVQMESGFRFPDNTIALYVERCLVLYDTLVGPVQHAAAVVGACAAKTKICVASNGERVKVLKSLGLCGLRPEYFTEETIFTKDQVRHGKPAPDLFLHAARQMGADDPSRCLVIEDSVTGVMAGVAAGMTVWGFTGVSHAPQKARLSLEKAGAARVLDSLIHMPSLLGY